MSEEETTRIVNALFVRAKECDEFEYACARVRGVEEFGWDPLIETQELFSDVGTLLQAPLANPARVRLGLLLYSHLTEVDAIYEMLANLIAISMGERYTMDPFGDLYTPRNRPRYDQRPPSAKQVVERVKAKAREADVEEIADPLDSFFNGAIRNAHIILKEATTRNVLSSRRPRITPR
jgi:hypothetical protein